MPNNNSGKPPRWTPLPGETRLPQDSGDYFRDKNASKFPSHLMESTVLAALTLHPDLPADLDIVACYSSLGNLVRFVLGKDKSFRVLVQAVYNTVFFVRRENSPTEKLEGIKGHGHTFPEAYTTWDRDVKGSDTSHRILKYRFGGLRMLVRAEVDAYLANKDDSALPPGATRSAEKKGGSAPSPTPTDITSISQLISTLNPTAKPPPSPSSSATKINIVKSPVLHRPVPQSQLLEIKTRGIWKKDKEDTAAEEMPKLWLAQIPNLVVAYHDRGTFLSDIPVQSVGLRVERWEKLAKRELSCFAALLHEVVGMVRARSDKKLELCRTGKGGLEVREQCADAGELLSEETKGRWMDGGKKGGEAGDGGADEYGLEAEGGGAEIGISDDGAWDGGEDWTFCSGECGYCGECKK
jgi:hypothetical protein